MNPKESDNRELSREVLERLPALLDGPTVLGIGEIGLNRVTRNEIATYTEQVALAAALPAARADPHAAPRGQAQGHARHDRRAAPAPRASRRAACSWITPKSTRSR